MWPEKTEKVLKELSKHNLLKKYIFVGGSALSFYLKHRLSEDIDLFSEKDFLSRKTISNLIDKLSSDDFECKYTIQNLNQIDVIIDFVKVTFYASGEKFLSDGSKYLIGNIIIASFEVLVYMKAKALGYRGAFRDYYDIYAISKKIGFDKMLDVIKSFNENFNFKLFFSQLTYMDDVESSLDGSLKGAYEVNKNVILSYFKNEIRGKLNRYVD